MAAWLLDRLGIAARNPALIGDLLEELHAGRRHGWYWRQTLLAIAAHARCNARLHRGQLRAILTGWALQAGAALAIYHYRLGPQSHGIPWRLGACALVLASAALWGGAGTLLKHTWRATFALAADTFVVNLLVYGLCVLLAGFSLPCLLCSEIYWLLTDLRGPLFDKHRKSVC